MAVYDHNFGTLRCRLGRAATIPSPKGTRPRQVADQRYESACIFGAVCPVRDKGAALVAPYANAEAMQKHLEEISASIAPGSHGVVIMDGAGWHKADALNIPENLTILFLPPYSPELNPPLSDCMQSPAGQRTENIWQFLRQTYLSNRLFETWVAIVDACCHAWNHLTAETGRIRSIATRKWAVTGQ